MIALIFYSYCTTVIGTSIYFILQRTSFHHLLVTLHVCKPYFIMNEAFRTWKQSLVSFNFVLSFGSKILFPYCYRGCFNSVLFWNFVTDEFNSCSDGVLFCNSICRIIRCYKEMNGWIVFGSRRKSVIRFVTRHTSAIYIVLAEISHPLLMIISWNVWIVCMHR